MNKKRSITKALAVILTALMIFTTIPLASFAAKYVSEFYSPSGTQYISIAVMQYSKSSSTKCNEQLTNLGFTPVGKNFNAGDGHSSHYVNMGVKYTTDPTQAIRAFRIVSGDAPNYMDSIINGVSVRFYKLGSGATDWTNAFGSDGSVDLNREGGGEYLFMYATRDPNAGPPVTEFTMTQAGKYDDAQPNLAGWYHVTSFDNVNSTKDCNAGQGGDYLFAHWKSSATAVDTTELRKAYDDSSKYASSDNFTQASRNTLISARNNAATVINAFDNNAGVTSYTQSDINNRKNAITNALNALQTTVYFNGNGGTVSKASKDFTIGTKDTAEVSVADVTATRNGHDFAGWSLSNGVSVGTKDKMTLGHNATVYAIWKIHSSTLKIDPAGGVFNGSSSVTEVTRNFETTYSIPVPTREGYHFTGWTFNGSNGTVSGTDATAQTYKFGAAQGATDTLTANWSANVYTVNYNGNGADGGSTVSSTHSYDTSSALSKNGFTRTGFNFVGWSSSMKGDAKYADGASVTNLSALNGATIDLYAVWKLNTYTISYDGNGATSGNTAPTACSYNTDAKIAANGYLRTGYSFSGWATEKGGKVVYKAGDTVKNLTAENGATVTLYAVWAPLKYRITFKNYDGEILSTQFVEYDSVPVYSGKTPTKAQNDSEVFTFAGWSPEISAVKGETEYVASFTSSPRQYRVSFMNESGTAILWSGMFDYGSIPVYGGEEPTKASTKQYSFTFAGWDRELEAVKGSQSYKARFRSELNKYTATFLDVNGSVLWETTLPYGSQIIYGGETPVKESDVQHDYTFSGWNKPFAPITDNVTFTPLFSASTRSYKVRFVNHDGALLKEYSVKYGDTPVYDGETPTKASTVEEQFEFAGWDSTVSMCVGEKTYTATFTASPKMYKIRFVNFDGELVKEAEFGYGSTPSCDIVPERSADNKFTYTFSGWGDIKPVTGDATYTALYSTSFTKHIIKFVDGNGTVLQATEFEWGQMPVYSGTTPTKNRTAQYTYTFKGWDSELAEVTEPATYTATFDASVNKYTVVFKNYDGTELFRNDFEYGTTPAYAGETPTRPSDVQYTYSFNNWGDVKPVTGYAEYTAVYSATLNKYTVRFVSEDGTVLYDEQSVDYGTTPVYSGVTPTKDGTVQYSYSFKGWDKDLEAVTGDAIYYARFDATVNKYTVKFVNEDGTVLDEQSVEYGTTPVYGGITPTKTATARFSYVWSGWDKELDEVVGDTVYTACFTELLNSYKVIFKNYDGTVLQDREFDYGTTPAYLGETPVKAGNAQYSYVFAGWTPEIDEVKGEAEYTAAFTETVNKYHVIFKNYDGTVLQDTELEYGATPVYSGEAPVRDADDDYIYTFAGWQEDFAPIVGETVFNAKYSTRSNRFTVKFTDDRGNLLQSKDYRYGAMPSFDGEVTKESDLRNHYTFTGWNKPVTAVTGFATYVAVFASEEHTFVTVSDTAPTCTEVGKKVEVCTECGFTVEQETPATGHNFGESFIENGKAFRECENCGGRIEIPLDEAEHEQSLCKYCGKYHYKWIRPDFGWIFCVISRFFTFLGNMFNR